MTDHLCIALFNSEAVDRLTQAYPIHPEVFDRLYEDWTTVDGFQRTRGVLKLMAKVISRLWKDNNKDLLIMPGSLPLANGDVRNEMTYLLPQGWEAVIESDIDGDKAETTDIEGKEPRFGKVNAARRVARTLFLGTAPSSVSTKPSTRGLDRGRILLGCLQPAQMASDYLDVVARMADRLHYINSTGDVTADATRYWFDTRANLRREMETRKHRFDLSSDVRKKIEEVVKKLFASVSPFDGVHVFTPHADVPDDSVLRLVILPCECTYMKEDTRKANDAILEYLRMHGNQPRHRANRLLFIAADNTVLNRLQDATRVALAWDSIVEDVEEERLNIDQIQKRQAERESHAANAVLPRAARECFKWLLCPVQDEPTSAKPTIEASQLNTTSGHASGEIERVCRESELVIYTWSPIHLRAKLKELYWKPGKPTLGAVAFWEDSIRYLYLPRLKSREVLNGAVKAGATSKDFFGTAYGQKDGKYEGFAFGDGDISFNDTLLLIEPEEAMRYAIEQKKIIVVPPPEDERKSNGKSVERDKDKNNDNDKVDRPRTDEKTPKLKSFHGTVEVNSALAKSKLNTIADEVIKLLHSDSHAAVRITLEIDAEFPLGVSDTIKRAVSENAANLGFKVKDWE